MQIDFLATQPHFIDHLAPVWDTLAEQNVGTFYVPQHLLGHSQSRLKHRLYLFSYEGEVFREYGSDPMLVCSYGDMLYAREINPTRRIFMMEHGTGHTFGKPPHPNGIGKRDWVELFLSPNQYTVEKIKSVRPWADCDIIGTPKLDAIYKELNPNGLEIKFAYNNPPTIAIGFHWGHQHTRPPENGSAFEHYKDYIPTLAKEYKLLGYGHPIYRDIYKPFYEERGIEYVDDFYEVMRRADICLNDLSSALYEFLVTGKPVIVLNAPWFRRDIDHGIRFWDYSMIGVHVNDPSGLLEAIEHTLDNYLLVNVQGRRQAIQDLYPYLGCSAERTAGLLSEYLSEEDNVKSI